MAHDVFVSYSSKDKVIADTIVAALENNNIRCWYAPRDIKPSEDWGKAITLAVEKAKVFLMIFSDSANHSQRVLDELNYAITQQAVILPFRVENLEPDGAMKLHLASRHWLDAYDPSWRSHIKNLIKAISDNLEINLLDDEISMPTSLKSPTKFRKPILSKIIIGGVVGAIVITAGWYGWSLLSKRDLEQSEIAQMGPVSEIVDTSTPEIIATIPEEPSLEPTAEPTLPDSSSELGTPDYETDFSLDSIDYDAWPIGKQDADGYVELSAEGSLIISNYDALLFEGNKNYVNSIIEVDARFLSSDSNTGLKTIDLLCRTRSDNNQGYRAFITKWGDVFIDAQVSGDNINIASAKISSFDIDKYYRLRFECVASHLRLYINGQLVAQGDDSTYFQGWLGLSTLQRGGPAITKAEFDNFKLWVPY